MILDNDFKRSFSNILSEIAKYEWGLLGAQVVLAVFAPAIIGYAINLITGDDESLKKAGLIVLILALPIQLILLVATLLGPSTPVRAIIMIHDLKNKIDDHEILYEDLEDQRNSYYSSVLSANQSLTVVQAILDSGMKRIDTLDLLEDDLRRILEPYVYNRKWVFNFLSIEALYRITIFMHTMKGVLQPVYTFADVGIEVRGRTWTPSTGHAGRTFNERHVIISPDLANGDEYKHTYDEIDKKNYRSMASVPLYVRGTVWGVAVITSNEPEQFNYTNSVEIFETIGHILSLYLQGVIFSEEVRSGR